MAELRDRDEAMDEIAQVRASVRALCTGIESIMRVQANGAMQFERTLKRCMSSAMPRESPTMPNLAAM